MEHIGVGIHSKRKKLFNKCENQMKRPNHEDVGVQERQERTKREVVREEDHLDFHGVSQSTYT